MTVSLSKGCSEKYCAALTSNFCKAFIRIFAENQTLLKRDSEYSTAPRVFSRRN
jgi:hypothetical protein